MTKKELKIKISVLTVFLIIVILFISIGLAMTSRPSPTLTPIPTPTVIVNANTSSTSSTSSGTPTSSIEIKPTSSIPIMPAEPTVSIGHAVGIAGGGGLSKIGASELNWELDQMVSLGVKWVRFDIEWGNVQYDSSSSFMWDSYDALVNALVAHHLHGLGVITFTPQWARVPGCTGGVECPPQDPAQFATFAEEVAARYKNDSFHYWEIWNEPNNFNFWATKTDCNAYTALLKATYPAIKLADPNAVVITGGLAPEVTNDVDVSPTDFLSCIYQSGGGGYFDAVGAHPYSFPQFPSQVTDGAWAQMSKTSPSLRSIMVAHGDTKKKIWITEFGVPTNGPDPDWYITEAEQAQMVTDTFQLYKTYAWAGPFFWYTFRDSGTSTSTNENFFGLTRADGSLKPAYTTMQGLISAGL